MRLTILCAAQKQPGLEMPEVCPACEGQARVNGSGLCVRASQSSRSPPVSVSTHQIARGGHVLTSAEVPRPLPHRAGLRLSETSRRRAETSLIAREPHVGAAMDLATLSEAARSLGPSPGPPKPSLPPPPRAMKPDPFLPPPMHPTPEAVHQQSPSDAQTNLQGALFSPLFQCATTLPFYAALLNELQAMATLVDPCPAVVREIIWEHVFLLIGVQPHRCDLSLKPIIEAWLSAPTVNLLAVELLYIAFVRALANHPDLLRAQTQNVVRGPNFPPSAPAPAAAQQSSTTFVQRPFKRYTGAEVQAPQPTKQKPAFFENETTMLNSKYLTPPNANPVTATEVYFLVRARHCDGRTLCSVLSPQPSRRACISIADSVFV